MAKGYKINRSNYTIRRRHQLVSGGQVTERDFMTTTNLGSWDSGSIPYGESNFRMLYRNPDNIKKKNVAGSWIKSECAGGSEFWNGGCIEKSGVTEETLIKEKPNYKSLLDFAYFGSCTELIRTTIKKIIEEFPGEINIYDKEPFIIDGSDYYLVNNPFDLDLFDTLEESNFKNVSKNFFSYVIIDSGETYDIDAVSASTVNPDACEHGDIVRTSTIYYSGNAFEVYEIVYDNERMLFTQGETGVKIRPREKYVEEFFDNLDDFGNMLLNRDSSPKYTITIDWPHETDNGVMTYEKTFTWPIEDDGWNIDITSYQYEKYVSDLLSVSEFYDEYYTDNLWRMLTHDSIKNMDITFSKQSSDEDSEDYNIGTTRLRGLLLAYGRQFDEIKRSIDNIKRTSTVTYDENGNVPDYFLSDMLELDGWEVRNVDYGINESGVSVDWGTVERTYSSEKANDTFLRTLKINSKHIFSKKGTVDGIVSLLGLFGMTSGTDYEINEYVAVVDRQIESISTGETSFRLSEINGYKENSETSYTDEYDEFSGIPFTYVTSGDKKYVIPWYDNMANYDGGTYFQMKGGWMKIDGKYDETIKYLSVVPNMADMYSLPAGKRYENAICYVENVENADVHENHYFKLINVDEFDNASGWTKPSEAEVEYIDSIIDDYIGNNPHVGYGNYDGGKEYIERIKFPFKPTENFTEGAYDCNGTINPDCEKQYVHFMEDDSDGELNWKIKDNKKVWFFGDVSGGTLNMDYNVFDFESGEDGEITTRQTEPASNSIVNVKNIDFTFYIKREFADDFEKYFNKVVFPYLKQMVPSTAICSVKITLRDAVPFNVNISVPNPYRLEVDGIAFKDGDSDSVDDFIVNYNEEKWLK